jgi:hypothetical protein
MSKILSKAAITAAIVIVVSSAAYSQTTVVNMRKGVNTVVLTGRLKGYRGHRTYSVRVRKGQTLTTESIGQNHITVDITAPRGSHYEPDLAADCHDRNEVSPTAAGIYMIRVNECTKADAWRGTFRLRLRVR